jgi:hypothetical protein
VWLMQVVYRALGAAVMAWLWRRGGWAKIDV